MELGWLCCGDCTAALIWGGCLACDMIVFNCMIGWRCGGLRCGVVFGMLLFVLGGIEDCLLRGACGLKSKHRHRV